MSASPTQKNESAARRLMARLPACRPECGNAYCRERKRAARAVLRAVLRRTPEGDLREFCRAALRELGGE